MMMYFKNSKQQLSIHIDQFYIKVISLYRACYIKTVEICPYRTNGRSTPTDPSQNNGAVFI